jgi:outer membrane biosynthesis protein TonB
MNLIRYIQGIRKGREINRLEREAMEDLFLADALEGYDKVCGDHEIRIKGMQNRISAQTRSSTHTLHYWSIAACILLVIGIGGSYILWDEFNQPEAILIAESTALKPSDTATLENLEEVTPADSPVTEYKLKEYSTAQDKQSEAIIIKEEEVANEQEITMLPVMDLAELKSESPLKKVSTEKLPVMDLADLKGESPLKEVSPEKKALTVDTVSIPRPVAGINAYNEYLKKNLIRPADGECKNITGVVALSFPVDKNGRPYNLRIIKSLCSLADWEAMRLVKEGPDWTTGESVATVNVHF